jgi:hypothetical protein
MRSLRTGAVPRRFPAASNTLTHGGEGEVDGATVSGRAGRATRDQGQVDPIDDMNERLGAGFSRCTTVPEMAPGRARLGAPAVRRPSSGPLRRVQAKRRPSTSGRRRRGRGRAG